MPDNRKLKPSFWTIFGVIGFCVLFGAYIYLFRPFSPNGTKTGINAIQNYEAAHEGCDGAIMVVTSRKMIKGRVEGSWYEAWKIRNSCDETHQFLIHFGISPAGNAFVIKLEPKE